MRQIKPDHCDHAGTSQGGEDIDEVFFEDQGVCLHIEKMADNEYMVRIDSGKKTATMFIGHWPQNMRKKGKLKINVADNNHARWHY